MDVPEILALKESDVQTLHMGGLNVAVVLVDITEMDALVGRYLMGVQALRVLGELHVQILDPEGINVAVVLSDIKEMDKAVL